MSHPLVRLTSSPPVTGSRGSRLRDLTGRTAGYLQILDADADADADADPDAAEDTAKIDRGVLDADGGPGWISLAWSEGAAVPFDDVAVVGALRACLRLRGVDFLSTLTRGDDTIAGAIIGITGSTSAQAAVALRDDPFARLFPRRLVSYGQGLFGRASLPAGPSTQRYGASTPWPNARF